MNYKKYTVPGLVIIIVVLLGVIVFQARSTPSAQYSDTSTSHVQTVASPSVVTTTTTHSSSDIPTVKTSSNLMISSITPIPVQIGSAVTIKGKGFATQPSNGGSSVGWLTHSHVVVRVTNASGISAILWEGNPDSVHDTVLTTTLAQHLCTYSIQDQGDQTCNSFLNIVPGKYHVTVSINYLNLISNSYLITVNQ